MAAMERPRGVLCVASFCRVCCKDLFAGDSDRRITRDREVSRETSAEWRGLRMDGAAALSSFSISVSPWKARFLFARKLSRSGTSILTDCSCEVSNWRTATTGGGSRLDSEGRWRAALKASTRSCSRVSRSSTSSCEWFPWFRSIPVSVMFTAVGVWLKLLVAWTTSQPSSRVYGHDARWAMTLVRPRLVSMSFVKKVLNSSERASNSESSGLK